MTATVLVPLALWDRSQGLALRWAHQLEGCVWTQAGFPWSQGLDPVADSSKKIPPSPKKKKIFTI